MWIEKNINMQNILVTGSNGQLGSELKKQSEKQTEFNFLFADLPELDITDYSSVSQWCNNHEISVIINCAAYTSVDRAEEDRETADQVNHLGPKVLAQVASETGATLIHISTDYVFNGEGHFPYTEAMDVSPLGVYGVTKLAGEEAVKASGCRSVIIRTSWLYSIFGNNFVKTMLRLGAEREQLGVIADQVGSPTNAADLAAAILVIVPQLLAAPKFGEVYHFSNEGVASWYDFSRAIMDMAGLDCRVNAIGTKDYPTPANRPHYSVMSKEKIKAHFGVEVPYWRESLAECVVKLKSN